MVRKADRSPLTGGVNGDQIRMALPVFLPTLGDQPGPWGAFTSALATPLNQAVSLHHQIRGSRLLVGDTYGHTSWFNSECARGHATTYFLTGKLPARGTTC